MKILCLGNNTEDTDVKTRKLAQAADLPCYGLISELDGELEPSRYVQPGYYHTSVYDLAPGHLAQLIEQFDQVVMLDQPKSQWSHPYAFNNTIAAIKSAGPRGSFVDPALARTHDAFDRLVKTNPSFCVFPFIQLYTFSNGTAVCCRSSQVITRIQDYQDWHTDPNYQALREKMIRGERVPEHCGFCYRQEDAGRLSPRQSEVTEWVQRLDIDTVEQLQQLPHPAYYDIRPSNRCNLQCRMCNPDDSHLIAKEYKLLGIDWPGSQLLDAPKHYVGFDVVDLDTVQKLSVAGGEPSIMVEFYEFLQQCIDRGRTDFEISITTNANRFSEKFKSLLSNFSNINFIVSIDGYQDLNHYIRYPSEWNNIVTNMQYLQSQGRLFSTHTTISIYNVSALHDIFEFMDREFPGVIADWDFVENPDYMSPFAWPDQDSALASLHKVIHTQCYKNAGAMFRDRIDALIDWFENQHHIQTVDLWQFFQINDKLDQSRNIRLIDHVPVLDKYRSVVV